MSHRPLMPKRGSRKWARIVWHKGLKARKSWVWDERGKIHFSGGHNGRRFDAQCRGWETQ